MAYISVADTKKVRVALKDAFKGTGIKLGVRNRDKSTLEITLKSGPLDPEFKPEDRQYFQINTYYPENYSKDVFDFVNFIKQVSEGVKGSYNRNAGDIYADYPDMTYFLDVDVGSWDKPFVKTEGSLKWDSIKENYKKHVIKRKLRETK